jgi:hypothetical protein
VQDEELNKWGIGTLLKAVLRANPEEQHEYKYSVDGKKWTLDVGDMEYKHSIVPRKKRTKLVLFLNANEQDVYEVTDYADGKDH